MWLGTRRDDVKVTTTSEPRVGQVNPPEGGQLPLPSFAAGAWEVPEDMAALVHAGEMIVPGEVAAAVRAALGDRGGFEDLDPLRATDPSDEPALPEAEARAVGRATARRARLLGLVGPGRAGGSIG